MGCGERGGSGFQVPRRSTNTAQHKGRPGTRWACRQGRAWRHRRGLKGRSTKVGDTNSGEAEAPRESTHGDRRPPPACPVCAHPPNHHKTTSPVCSQTRISERSTTKQSCRDCTGRIAHRRLPIADELTRHIPLPPRALTSFGGSAAKQKRHGQAIVCRCLRSGIRGGPDERFNGSHVKGVPKTSFSYV